ncbi:C-signal-like [Genypterus blacodes]|uniref:C-signal-like n=1 Tax=Genypterus blacodes TaxID=154954 RepID=UPI003F7757A7
MAFQLGSVLVTGASRGLGLEMVQQLVQVPRATQRVFACCRDPDGAKAEALRNLAEKHPNITIIRLDVTEPLAIKQSVQQVSSLMGTGGLNLLVNNAGIGIHGDMETTRPEDMQTTFSTNVISPLTMIQEFLPLLRAAAKASEKTGMSCSKAAIINMSTIMASMELVKSPIMPAVSYRISKAGLNMLTRCAAVGLGEDGILVASLHPGWVRTDMGGEAADIDAQESVRGLLSVMDSLTEKHNGAFLDYKGQTLPW